MKGNKKELIKQMGLTKFDRDVISVYNFDVKEDEVTRDIYIDGRGDEWAYLWGEFYRIERDKTTYRYHVIV